MFKYSTSMEDKKNNMPKEQVSHKTKFCSWYISKIVLIQWKRLTFDGRETYFYDQWRSNMSCFQYQVGSHNHCHYTMYAYFHKEKLLIFYSCFCFDFSVFFLVNVFFSRFYVYGNLLEGHVFLSILTAGNVYKVTFLTFAKRKKYLESGTCWSYFSDNFKNIMSTISCSIQSRLYGWFCFKLLLVFFWQP